MSNFANTGSNICAICTETVISQNLEQGRINCSLKAIFTFYILFFSIVKDRDFLLNGYHESQIPKTHWSLFNSWHLRDSGFCPRMILHFPCISWSPNIFSSLGMWHCHFLTYLSIILSIYLSIKYSLLQLIIPPNKISATTSPWTPIRKYEEKYGKLLGKKKRKRRNLKTSQIPTRCLRVKSDDSVWFFGDSLDKGFSAGFAIGREECVDPHRFTRAVCWRQGAGKKWGRAKANGASARPRLMDSKSFLKAVTALMRVRSCWS